MTERRLKSISIIAALTMLMVSFQNCTSEEENQAQGSTQGNVGLPSFVVDQNTYCDVMVDAGAQSSTLGLSYQDCKNHCNEMRAQYSNKYVECDYTSIDIHSQIPYDLTVLTMISSVPAEVRGSCEYRLPNSTIANGVYNNVTENSCRNWCAKNKILNNGSDLSCNFVTDNVLSVIINIGYNRGLLHIPSNDSYCDIIFSATNRIGTSGISYSTCESQCNDYRRTSPNSTVYCQYTKHSLLTWF